MLAGKVLHWAAACQEHDNAQHLLGLDRALPCDKLTGLQTFKCCRLRPIAVKLPYTIRMFSVLLAVHVCSLAQNRKLERQHVVDLLKVFIEQPSLLASDNGTFADCVDVLENLQPGRHLTREDVLELFEYCTGER